MVSSPLSSRFVHILVLIMVIGVRRMGPVSLNHDHSLNHWTWATYA